MKNGDNVIIKETGEEGFIFALATNGETVIVLLDSDEAIEISLDQIEIVED
jgi:hypothetical protein